MGVAVTIRHFRRADSWIGVFHRKPIHQSHRRSGCRNILPDLSFSYCVFSRRTPVRACCVLSAGKLLSLFACPATTEIHTANILCYHFRGAVVYSPLGFVRHSFSGYRRSSAEKVIQKKTFIDNAVSADRTLLSSRIFCIADTNYRLAGYSMVLVRISEF